MMKLELVAGADDILGAPVTGDPYLAPACGVHLRCPTCAWEVDHPRCREFDVAVKCPSCKATAEFRQWHEAWCASRREALLSMFPQMTWLTSGYSEIVPAGGATHEHLREIAP